MKISVVVPVYNSQDYVGSTLKSILKQKSNDYELEVIVINDGSKDSSDGILREIANQESCIKYIYQSNHGISYTRNKGMDIATGDYLLFCDDDDIYEDSLIIDNLKLIQEKQCDVVKFGRISKVVNENTEWKSSFLTNEFDIKNSKAANQFIGLSRGGLLTYIWDAIYDLKFLKSNKIRFDETMLAGEEDRNFNYKLILKNAKIFVNDNYYYIHNLRNMANTTSKYSSNRIESLKKNILLEKKIINYLNVEKYDYYSELFDYLRLFVIEVGKSSDLNLKEKGKLVSQFCNQYNMFGIKTTYILRSKFKIKRNIVVNILINLRLFPLLFKLFNG